MAKARIGHFVEGSNPGGAGCRHREQSEVLTPARRVHIEKTKFTIPFVCGARNLGEALRRIAEGAAMIRTKGEAGTGDVRPGCTAHEDDPWPDQEPERHG